MLPFSLLVVLGFAAYVQGQACPMGLLGDHCHCEQNNPGTFIITCSCRENEGLIISDRSTVGLAPTVVGFHIANCNASVKVKSSSFDHLLSLQRLSFRNITSLSLETRSLDLDHLHDFQLTIDSVLHLSLQTEAIKIAEQENQRMDVAIDIMNSFIAEMPPAAIKGSLSKLNFERVIFGPLVEADTVNVGSRGCKVSIRHSEANNLGFSSTWIVGNVNRLEIVNNKIILLPEAFAAVNMTGNSPTFVLTNNTLGPVRFFPGRNGSSSVPSLPSKSLDLHTLESNPLRVQASNNLVNCECESLAWVLEEPSNSLKREVTASLKCTNESIKSVIRKCQQPNASSTPAMSLALAIMLSILALCFS